MDYMKMPMSLDDWMQREKLQAILDRLVDKLNEQQAQIEELREKVHYLIMSK